ncbi:MAG: SUMF1/EgtB/PvdO family nonheme iron enzyme [Nitrospira sp.]|nr:SUMF1/EgtB/PvdO family nonheme iron enzyme [Nitrospira sp.]
MPMLTLWSAVVLLVLGLQGIVGVSTVLAESRGARLEVQKAVAGKKQTNGKPLAEFIAGQTGKSWAVVIGINEYQDPAVPRLKYAVADARAVAQELERRSYQVTLLLNEQATARAINTELRSKLRQRVGKQDRVVVYYAGHGLDDKVEGSQTMGYLLPVDGEKEDVPGTGISMGVVREMADALPAKHVLFLIDACYGGVAGQQLRSLSKSSEAYVRQITRERGRQLMTAGGADQEALEASDGGHGLFTTYLLKGLAEGLADTNQDGVIPASELYGYVESRVFKDAHLRRHEQRPEFWTLSAEKGEFVFLTARDQAGAATASITGQEAGPSPDELAKERAKVAALEARLLQLANPSKVTDPSKAEVPSTPMQVAKAYGLPQQASREFVGKDGAPMVLIPAGEFWMGSSDGEGSKDEHPRHYVRLDTFYMDKFEVTNRLFHQFIKNTGHKTKSWGDAYVEANWWAFPKEGRWESSEYASWQTPEGGVSVFDSNRAEHPVVSVTWDNAEAYCRWAGKRLPTEAEWEYAARAGTTTKYWWGANNPGSRKVENVADKSAQGFIRYSTESYDDGFVRTAPVGSYEANPWGLHDINGNVSEWVDDWYVEDYYSRSPEHNPKPIGLSIDREVVYRGGSWMNALNISLASRFHSFLSSPEMFRRPDVGFRCAQDVPK